MGVLTVPLLFTSLLLSALTGGPSTAPLPGESVRERVEVIVREAVEEPASDLRALEYLLIDLGPDAIEPLFELLVAGEVAVGGDSESSDVIELSGLTWPTEPVDPLGPAGERLLLGALAGLPHVGLLAVLGALEVPLEANELRAAHLALGACGDAGDIALVIRLTTPASTEAALSRAARAGFEDALSSLLARHRGEGWLVARHYAEAHPVLRALLLRAAERAHMSNEIALFAGLLGVHPELDVLLLGQLARVGHPWGTDMVAVGSVRDRLHSRAEREVLAAVIAIAAFEDPESVEPLIGLLGHENPQLREQVIEALVRTTGRNFRGDAERWQAWHADAAAWWQAEAPGLFEDLWSRDRGRAAAAANELTLHPLYRREVERELLASLDPARPELCALMCRVLGSRGSPLAIEPLEALSEERDEWVAEAARGALEELSRRTRPEFTEPGASFRR